jgi:hypothetical protein
MRLPRTKDEILDELEGTGFIATNLLEAAIPLILEVLIDIRDNTDIDVFDETSEF